MRRHNERLLTTIHLGITVDAIDCNLGKAVESIGIQDKRYVELKQTRNHLHGTGRCRHAGTTQHAAIFLGNLTYRHARSGTKRTAGIRWNSKDRNRGERHADKVGTRIRSRDCHIAGACAGSGLGRHNGRTRILRRSGNNEHRAARVLIDIRRQRSKIVHKVTGFHDLGSMVDIVNNLIKAVIQTAADHIACIFGTVSAV